MIPRAEDAVVLTCEWTPPPSRRDARRVVAVLALAAFMVGLAIGWSL